MVFKTAMCHMFDFQATDSETDTDVTYRIIAGNTPDQAFRINPDTGELSLTRRVDYEETDGKG